MGDLSKAGMETESDCAKPFRINNNKTAVTADLRIKKGSGRKNSLSDYDAISSDIRCFAKIFMAGINSS